MAKKLKYAVLNMKLRAKLCFAPEVMRGHVHLTIDSAQVSRRRKKVGDIRHIIGGGIQVIVGERAWHITAKDVFEAVERAAAKAGAD